LSAIDRILHIDDELRLSFFQALFRHERAPDVTLLSASQVRMLEGLMMTLWSGDEKSVQSAVRRMWAQPAVRSEILQLLDVLDDRAAHRTYPLVDDISVPAKHLFEDVPLQLHARYTRHEVFAAIGRESLAKPFSHREGPFWHPDTNTDYFFITLDKSEKYYSPSTRYRDYAISPEVFHWESQSTTREASPTGQRYINHVNLGSNVMLLVRSRNKDGMNRTVPFTLLGPATYVQHEGERPMAIVWRLHRPMPLDFFSASKVAT
jgi:hypothetical protein